MKFDTQVFLVLGILFVGALTAFSFLALDKIVPSILLELLTAYFSVAEVQSDLSSLYADITETSAMQRIVYDLILIALGLIKILLNLAILELILVVHFYISIYQLYQSIKAIFVSLVAVDRYARSFWNEMSLVCSSKY
ncbi:hypothetical protein N7450_006396 [Penicillium hetheringtonii]|uniref:Uncharacterized protein n=1 Tax=Penicillium hetheringtonii TaxID=911720 RepID=A0AAD6DLL6_9EURO|nr:hypothetical protein N7450_006396 [Penicillium hetheringtonii]